MRFSLPVLLLATAAVACSKAPAPPNIPLDQMSSRQPAAADVLTGQVLEHITASPYSYVRLKTSTGEVWAAVNESRLETGSQVTVSNAILMKQFESKAMKRTFDEIYFGSLAAADAAAAGTGADPHAGAASTAAPFDVTVEKASGSSARTVAETWAAVDGKAVTVRGKVVKVNEGVMGKNWIHLQDGSGNAAQGNNDLTVTSLDVASIGETVTITGTVGKNKDFGSGYVYPVIVEDAKVVKK